MKRHAMPADWTGRVDAADGPLARRWHQAVTVRETATSPVALVGFASDAGVVRNHGRIGAAEGPLALRRALANVPLQQLEAIDDLGDVVCDRDALEEAQVEFAAMVSSALVAGALPVGLGGGHEIAYASWSGLAAALGTAGDRGSIAVINVDAHLDLRGDPRATSGTPFRQILEAASAQGREVHYLCLGASRYANTQALFERARTLGATWILDEDVRLDRWQALSDQLVGLLASVDHVYLTVCLDAFPAAVAPGVSAPAAMGIDAALVERLLDRVTASGKLRVADIAELNPRHDIDARTARLAARLLARIAEGAVAAKTQPLW